MRRITAVVCLLAWSLSALAHKPSDSYLTLRLGAAATGQWDIALRDLDYAIGLDGDGDGAVTWGELRARHAAIAAYALARLRIFAGGRPCAVQPAQHLVDRHSDGAYAVLRFALDCPPGSDLTLDYRLFFDLDPTHRGLVQVRHADAVQTAVLSPDQPQMSLHRQSFSAWRAFVQYWREGVRHIWKGFDHLLFLTALLLPAVLWRDNGRWRQAEALRPVLASVAGIVTAFTMAHSLTLGAAVLGVVSLPARWVESAIAATVVLAALNNLYPLVQGRRWLVAFALGLIHGFGFAAVLAGLGLPGDALALALAGFNLGVECGQLAVVAGFLPLAWLLRGSWLYRRAVVDTGSLAVAAVALVWFLERSLAVRWLPF
ncbi:MAG: HupE/UreJ family protein [Pseudomonadota bacterium]|nr:HupE/UreJ family protein [Pseudomonadota bacterium]